MKSGNSQKESLLPDIIHALQELTPAELNEVGIYIDFMLQDLEHPQVEQNQDDQKE